MTNLLEISQEVAPVPAVVAERAPSIIIRLGTTVITHTVHNGTASEDFACIGHKGLIRKVLLRGRVDLEHVRVIVTGTVVWP